MDEVIVFLLNFWHRIIGIWADFPLRFSVFEISFLDFVFGIIILSALFNVLLVLPSRFHNVKTVSERNNEGD